MDYYRKCLDFDLVIFPQVSEITHKHTDTHTHGYMIYFT